MQKNNSANNEYTTKYLNENKGEIFHISLPQFVGAGRGSVEVGFQMTSFELTNREGAVVNVTFLMDPDMFFEIQIRFSKRL